MKSNPIFYQVLICLSFAFSMSNATFAQEKNKEFKFRFDSDKKIQQSSFNHIKVVDSRADTSHFGLVQKGLMNKTARVVASPSLDQQLNSYLKTIVLEFPKTDTLVLQIRRLNFSEGVGGLSEKGFFNFRANLYEQKNGFYHPITSIDSNFQVSGIDVTNKLLNRGSKIIDDFIRQNLTSTSSNENLTLTDLYNIDFREKQQLPLYAAEHLTNGIYKDYESLKKQIPTYPLLLERNKKGELKYYYRLNEKNKKIKIKDSDIYAIVENDSTFISTAFGYYHLFMENEEYYFYGELDKVNKNSFFSMSFGMGTFGSFGGVGTGVSVGGFRGRSSQDYKIKIDHIDGKFEKVEELTN